MRNIIIKLISIMLISGLLIINIPLYSNAESGEDETWLIKLKQVAEMGQNFANDVKGSSGGPNFSGVTNMISGVLGSIALAVTGISAIIMSISFVIQSVEDKAKIKESMVPWIIGIIISFGAFGIWKLVMQVMENAFK